MPTHAARSAPLARRKPDTAAATETLREIDSTLDRIAGSVLARPGRFLAVLGALLLVAAAIGGFRAWNASRQDDASAAVAAVVNEYLTAMGATPGMTEISEPANPETARAIRAEYAERFQEVGEAHAGTPAAAQAFLEAGNLQQQLGELEAALDSWQQGVDSAPAGSLRGLLLSRLARGQEEAGRWAEATATHLAAAETPGFPAAGQALADAARSAALAGDREQALALWQRVQDEAPEASVPEHVRAQLEELEAASQP